MPSRRDFLVASAALAATPLLGAEPDRLVDVHHHFFDPAYLKRKASEILARSAGYPQVLQWTPERSLEEMQAGGVTTAVLSMSAPLWFGDRAETRELSRGANEFTQALLGRYPGRFGYFAVLPLPSIEDSLAEVDYALGAGKADGVALLTNYEDLYLGDARFLPLLEALDARGALVYVHPSTASCCRNLVPEVSPAFLELPFDTTRTIASLLYSGALSRFRNIRFIFSHGGGALPFLADRLSQWARARPDLAARLPDGALAELRRLHFDTASVTNAPAMAALRAFAPATQLLFGTDYPYVKVAPQAGELARLGLSADDQRALRHANAERLLPRLARGGQAGGPVQPAPRNQASAAS
jgi:predicted TIM-barrel fold metal-dependent hydrolase